MEGGGGEKGAFSSPRSHLVYGCWRRGLRVRRSREGLRRGEFPPRPRASGPCRMITVNGAAIARVRAAHSAGKLTQRPERSGECEEPAPEKEDEGKLLLVSGEDGAQLGCPVSRVSAPMKGKERHTAAIHRRIPLY